MNLRMSPHHPNDSVQNCGLKIKEVTSRDTGKAEAITELHNLGNIKVCNHNHNLLPLYEVQH